MGTIFTSRRFYSYLACSLLAVAAVMAICLCLGHAAFAITWSLLDVRLPRVLTAALVGAALAAAGVALQALLRNPLAAPSVLGISSGAALGVILGLFAAQRLPGSDLAAVPPHVLALGFGVVTMMLVYLLAHRRGRIEPLSLLLVGVMVATFNGALIMVLNLLVPHGIQANILVWMMGMIDQDITWGMIRWSAAWIIAGVLLLLTMAHQFNLQALGDQTARSLGVRLGLTRFFTFIIASLMTAVAVAISGPIGFVGLICPHICRSIFGPDHRVLLITAVAFGAIFLMSADTAVRTLANVTGGEIPVGVITAMCGGPFFILLMRRQLRRREAV